MKTWFSIKAKADTADISIFDEIGAWGISAKDFLDEFRTIGAATVKVSINSPGGNVFDAITMLNVAAQSGKRIEVEVLGVAASAASYFAMVGDKITMPKNTFMFLHNPISGMYGNAADMRDAADMLDKVQAAVTAGYAKRWNGTPEALTETLAAETWLTADECLALGLCDEVTDSVEATAKFDLDRKMPEHVLASLRAKAPEPTPPAPLPTPTTPVAALADLIQTEATAAGFEVLASLLAADPAIDTIEAVRAAINTAREVKAVCAVTGQTDEATLAYVRERKPLADVRAAINAARVAADLAANVDHTPNDPSKAPAPVAGFNTLAIWGEIKTAMTKDR